MADRSICDKPGAQCNYKHTDICIICGRARHWRERDANPVQTSCSSCGACFCCGDEIDPDGYCRPRPMYDGCATSILVPLPSGNVTEEDENPCCPCGEPWPMATLDKIKTATETWDRPETPTITR